NPRLHPKDLLPYLQGEIAEIKQKYGEFVLVCSSFDPKMKALSYAFPEEAAIDARLRDCFYEIVSRLSRSIPLVYRPHPSDGDEFASRIREMVPVERRFSILPWIAASRLVINAKCSSSLDAMSLSVPSATLRAKSLKHAKISGLSRRFSDVESLCRYVEGGQYSLTLPRYKTNYANIVFGPDKPATNIVDRFDTLEIPAVRPVRLIKRMAQATKFMNRVIYGSAMSEYLDDKYGRERYPERFPGFRSYFGGHLVVSDN